MEISAFGNVLLYGTVIGGLVIWLGPKVHNRLFRGQVYQLGRCFIGSIVLIITWYLLFWFMTLMAGRLAPWDLWGAWAPAEGTWQRQLNDFFTQTSNANGLAIIVVGISIGLFLIGVCRVTRHDQWATLLSTFAVANLAFLAIEFLFVLFVADHLPDLWLPQPRPSVDVGYHRTWPSALVTLILLGALYWHQARIVKARLK
jgi:hypothetical protein